MGSTTTDVAPNQGNNEKNNTTKAKTAADIKLANEISQKALVIKTRKKTEEKTKEPEKKEEVKKKPEPKPKVPEKKPETAKPEKKEKNWQFVHGTLWAENSDGSMSTETTGIGIRNKKGTVKILVWPTRTEERSPSGDTIGRNHPFGITGRINF